MVLRKLFGIYTNFYLLLCVVLCCSTLIIPISGFFDGAVDIEAVCRLKCNFNQVITDSSTDNSYCTEECRQNFCHAGCAVYEEAIYTTPCSDGCDVIVQNYSAETVEPSNVLLIKKQSCLIGCKTGLEEYVTELKYSTGPVPKPEVYPSGITHNSVELFWPGVSPVTNLTFTVQLQVIDLHTSWQNHESYSITPAGHLNVTDLHPFLTYKFKILFHVTTEHSFETNESAPVTTLAYGAPASSPPIRSLIAPSSTTISLSWLPPVYANGELLSYRLSLHSLDDGGHVINTDVTPDRTSWIFGHLLSGTKYEILVSAVNKDGEGPPSKRTVTTPAPPNLNGKEVPYLVFGAENLVVRQHLLELMRDVDRVLKKPRSVLVTGVGVHVGRELVLVSDDSGRVTLVDINGTLHNDDIFPILSQPASIDIDWLHNYAYIADGHRIYRCPVQNSYQCKAVMDLIPYRPREVKVDPLNGHLYYTHKSNKKGLFVVDMASFDAPGEPESKLLIDADIRTFTIDHDNLMLYYPNDTHNTVMSAYLDGTGISDTRRGNVARALFQGVSSLVHYNRRYFWTNASYVFGEEYSNRTYYHHSLPFLEKHFTGFNLYLPSSQPIPVPLNPPSDIEVLFTAFKAIITWKPPQKLNFQGEGAYKKWQYEVSIVQADGTSNSLQDSSHRLTFEVSNLKPDTSYQIRVRARSPAGHGPWSPSFYGRTLQRGLDDAKLVLAVQHDQYKTWEFRELGMEGDVQRTIARTSPIYPGVKDMSWYGEKLFWTTDDRMLFMHRGDTDEVKKLDFAADVSCVTFDWLGEKLYWSVYRNAQIKRSDMYGKNEEFVYMARARHMTLDSVEGRLYWVTMDAVESSLLNGEDAVQYFALESFSNKQIISLAIDYDQRKLVWYVKGPDDQALYTADLHGYHGNSGDVINSVQMVGQIYDIDSFSVIQYLSYRLVWLDTEHTVRIGDALGNFTATVNAGNEKVTMVMVKHPSLHRYPAGLNASTIRVIPAAIPESSIRCQGPWSEFNITWQPAAEVNHGTVTFEVLIQTTGTGGENVVPLFTQKPWYTMTGLAPYSRIQVYVKAFTVWGTSENTTTTIRSPMAVPSQPVAPKVYVTQRKNAASSKLTLAADFRWSEPETLNGLLTKQTVYYWQSDRPGVVSTATLSASARHFILDEMKGNVTYFFQVESCTPVGCGPRSSTVNATTNAVNPVPKLLIATSTSIAVAEADNINSTMVTMATKSVTSLGHLSQDDVYFWVTRDGYLEQSSKRLFHLEGQGHHMAIDWISRSVYVVWNMASAGVILRYRLDVGTNVTFVEQSAKIGGIIVDPYTSSLVWTEYSSHDNAYKLFRSRTTDNDSVGPFFQHGRRRRRNASAACNCAADVNVASALVLDLSQDGHTELVFVDVGTMTLVAADMDGCVCRSLLNTTASDRKGLPGDHMTVDHIYMYWYQTSSSRLYMLDKESGTVSYRPLADVKDILAFGAHLQPLPGPECLDTNYTDTLEVVAVTNTSVRVRLQEVRWPDWCTNMSHPAIKYTVYYRADANLNGDCHGSGKCLTKESYGRELLLDNLQPYTKYIIQWAASNYFSVYSSQSLGNSTSVTTKPGVPSAVENFTVLPKNPNTIIVTWPPSQQPNGPADKIVYLVKWWTQLEDGVHDRMSDAITFDAVDPYNNGLFLKEITGLQADQDYRVKVLANQTLGGYITESYPMSVHTFEAPSDLVLLEKTNTSIQLEWVSPSDNSTNIMQINYAEVKPNQPLNFETNFDVLPFETKNFTLYNRTFTGLKPNTDYYFQLSIIYNNQYNQYDIYHWPTKDSGKEFVYKTLTGIPGPPDPPVVRELKDRDFEVAWVLPEENGEKITHFILQYKYIDKENWSVACNTSELRWVIEERVLQRGYTYMFRVMAENVNGWGPVSENSTLFSYPLLEKEPDNGITTVAAIVSAFVVVVIFMAVFAICFSTCRRRREEKKKKSEFVAVTRGPDLELATLRELPMTAIQQNNTLYAMNLIPTDDEIAALPHFRRDQLVLCKFLGSGAFGEVFEGLAKNIINESSGDTRCAVKTLRKSASDQEKEEFLKEALLMSNFHHDHILSLLGVCLDNDPQFIILELMEGGDLLSFMRACRLSSIQNQNRPELSLTDLVKICVHVARGCKYLEDMHFVHRDLAARNCLVSSLNPSTMVVKIGDFGLARDIYKNDYYRKEGEGLLPVRWMSPESLVDGVFTTQSDIWAFGVLMWEVVTFGQQPYPARTNIEVLHFVRNSGRLDRPDSCPEDFYQLMCKCWSYIPEERPAFSFLLQQLEKFHETCLSVTDYLVPLRSNRPIAMGGINVHVGSDIRWPAWRGGQDIHPSSPPKLSDERLDTVLSLSAAGYKYLSGRARTATETSSDGPEYAHMSHSSYGSHKSYGKIRRATSFDSPEPKDATNQVQTDAANYLEPKSHYVPTYIEFLPEDRTINYMYNVDGNRMRDWEKNVDKVGNSDKKVPIYVQTTVKENFAPNGQEYVKYMNQKSSSLTDAENDSEVKRIFSHKKNSADSVIMKTIENIPSACTNGNDDKRNSITSCSDLYSSQIINPSVFMNGSQPTTTHRPSFRKQRLDSSNSVKSFDSVQTEPVYSSYRRGKLYSSSSSKSNYSMSNISESAIEQLSPAAVEQLSPDPVAQQFWANNSTDCAKLVHKRDMHSHNSEYFNLGAKSQVYPENAGALAGYDIVHASLV